MRKLSVLASVETMPRHASRYSVCACVCVIYTCVCADLLSSLKITTCVVHKVSSDMAAFETVLFCKFVLIHFLTGAAEGRGRGRAER